MSKGYLLNMPEELHQDLKTAMLLEPGKTMKDLMIAALQKEYGGTRELLQRKGGAKHGGRVLDKSINEHMG